MVDDFQRKRVGKGSKAYGRTAKQQGVEEKSGTPERAA